MTGRPEATVAAIVLINDNGVEKVLLTFRAAEPFKGRWCLPGGHIEQYETAREAVSREVKEETGLEFRGHFFGFFDEIIPNHGLHAVVLAYVGHGQGKTEPQASEVANIGLFLFEEALSLELGFDHARILEAYTCKARKSIKVEPGPGILAEYSSLRDEILRRVEMRQQMLIYTTVLAGTLITLGVQVASRLPLLLFPVLAVLLALVWMHSDVRIGEIGEYIRRRVASQHTDLGDWELYIRQKNSALRFRPVEIAASGVFLVTELLSVLLVLASRPERFSREETMLLALDGLAIMLTIRIVWSRSRGYDKGPDSTESPRSFVPPTE